MIARNIARDIQSGPIVSNFLHTGNRKLSKNKINTVNSAMIVHAIGARRATPPPVLRHAYDLTAPVCVSGHVRVWLWRLLTRMLRRVSICQSYCRLQTRKNKAPMPDCSGFRVIAGVYHTLNAHQRTTQRLKLETHKNSPRRFKTQLPHYPPSRHIYFFNALRTQSARGSCHY